MHVNKLGNSASEEERGLQVCSHFFFRFSLELDWNAFNVNSTVLPLPRSLQGTYSLGLNISHANTHTHTRTHNTQHTHTTFPIIKPSGQSLLQ